MNELLNLNVEFDENLGYYVTSRTLAEGLGKEHGKILRTLTGDIRVISIGFRTYAQYLMNVTAELPDEFDIYIDEKKVK